MEVERELKYDLANAKNRDALLAVLPEKQTTERQINCFFDDAQRSLLRSLQALRIRLSDADGKTPRTEITLKGEAKQEGALSERPENSAAIEREVANDILAGKIELARLDAAPVRSAKNYTREGLIPLVSFENQRTTVPVDLADIRINLEIDTTTFQSGQPDYELEIESSDIDLLKRADGLAHELAGKAGFKLRPQPKSKFQRALERAGLQFNF